MSRHEIELELADLRWEEWMISVSRKNPVKVCEIRNRIAYLENKLRNPEK